MFDSSEVFFNLPMASMSFLEGIRFVSFRYRGIVVR